MSDLSRSDSYYRKICLETQGIVPVQTEVKSRLGDHLTKVFFESCLPALKPYLGLTPTLEGPGDDLWVSPSDLLIGKVRLKPPLTSKHIKALTHQGILEIGHIVEDKFNYEHELDKQRALDENEELLRYVADKEKQEAVARVRLEEKEIREEIIADLKEEFEETLKKELAKLEEHLEIVKKEAVEKGKKETERVMQTKLELAVLETVQRLTEQFAEELIKQSKCLHHHFWYHIRKGKEKLKKTILEERSQCQDNLEKLRIEMQSENLANVMYVLAKERRRCACEKQLIEQNFLARLEELEKELEDRGDKLQKTLSELEHAGLQIQAREAVLFEIIKQFQKFIYFVLRAVPTQAEYLLNIEKIMIFELTKTMMETKPQFFRPESTSAKSSTRSSTLFPSETAERTGLVAEDFHECDNYIKFIPSVTTMTSEQDLPAFKYDENLYVREDFRNMISQGLKISRSNALWNFAMDDVVDILEPDSRSPIVTSNHGNIAFGQEKGGDEPRKSTLSDKDHKSYVSVRFSKGFNQILPTEEKVLQAHSYSNTAVESAEEYAENSIDSGSIVSLDIPGKVQTRSKIELARDSLTILKGKKLAQTSLTNIESNKQKSVSKMSNISKSSKIPVTKTDSLILTAQKSVESKISGTKEVLSRGKESRLDLAIDSIVLLRTKDILRSVTSKQNSVCEHTKPDDIIKNRRYINVGVQVEPLPKSVQVSHIEVIPDMEEHKHRTSSVSFHAKPNIIPTDEESETILPCYIKEPKPPKRTPDEYYGRPSEVKVLGDPHSTAHLETQDEFTAKRVTSFIRIFREQPSLQRLFTEVINK